MRGFHLPHARLVAAQDAGAGACGAGGRAARARAHRLGCQSAHRARPRHAHGHLRARAHRRCALPDCGLPARPVLLEFRKWMRVWGCSSAFCYSWHSPRRLSRMHSHHRSAIGRRSLVQHFLCWVQRSEEPLAILGTCALVSPSTPSASVYLPSLCARHILHEGATTAVWQGTAVQRCFRDPSRPSDDAASIGNPTFASPHAPLTIACTAMHASRRVRTGQLARSSQACLRRNCSRHPPCPPHVTRPRMTLIH